MQEKVKVQNKSKLQGEGKYFDGTGAERWALIYTYGSVFNSLWFLGPGTMFYISSDKAVSKKL